MIGPFNLVIAKAEAKTPAALPFLFDNRFVARILGRCEVEVIPSKAVIDQAFFIAVVEVAEDLFELANFWIANVIP